MIDDEMRLRTIRRRMMIELLALFSLCVFLVGVVWICLGSDGHAGFTLGREDGKEGGTGL